MTFNGNSGTPATTTLYVKSGDAKVYTTIDVTTESSIPTVTRTGYTLNGWYTSSSGGSKVLNANGTFTGTAVSGYSSTNAWAATAAQNLYAQWTVNTYTVVYNANATGVTGTMSNSTHTYGVAKNLTKNTFERTNYRFIGWATSSTGTKVYSDEEEVTNLTTAANGTYNLYAVWELVSCDAVDVEYTHSGWSVNNVQEAIEDLDSIFPYAADTIEFSPAASGWNVHNVQDALEYLDAIFP